MQHDAWFFVGVFVFIFLIWIATGGPTHPIAFTGPTLAQPGILGGGNYLELPRAPFGLGGNYISLPGSSNTGGPIGGTSVGSSGTIRGVSFGTPSPYRGIVSLQRGITGAGSANINNEYLHISVSSSAREPIDITGWTLESAASGNTMRIPKGTETPISGTINEAENIVLLPGARAVVSSGRSPIGASFRENKCIGYFANFQTFTPRLPLTCPTPQSELTTYYSGYIRDPGCIEYVNKIPRCQVSLSPPATLSSGCQNFMITHLHYNGCMATHRSDADFFGTTWRVYLGRTSPMWRTKNEVVRLLDAQGKTVDAFSY